MIYITSSDNNAVKHFNSLKKKSYRKKTGEFAVEGVRAVHDSEKNGAVFTSCLIREGYDGYIPKIEKIYVAEQKLFDNTADTETSQGIICSAEIKTADIGDIKSKAVIICDNLRDPGNMGTVIRTAHAVDAGGILILKGCADPFAPKTVRATMGSIFKVPIVLCENTFCIDVLKQNGYSVAGGFIGDECENLFDAKLTGKWAFVVGNEGDGISDEILKKCDKKITIPMPGGVESLNASVACSLMLYEHMRKNQ